MKLVTILKEILGWIAVGVGIIWILIALQGSFTAEAGFIWDPVFLLLDSCVVVSCIWLGSCAIRKARIRSDGCAQCGRHQQTTTDR